MKESKFRFAPDILRRLGEELNPSPDKGILELVKNAYDADATNCTVALIGTEQLGGTVHVTDDGVGMDGEEIEKGWLVLGKSEKSTRKRTRLGRIPAGSKGLGRLAALRMGSKVLLSTRPKNQKNVQYDLLIDWKDFENVEVVDDVPLTIREIPRQNGSSYGTDIIISNLNTNINRNEVRKLARELILLANPFSDDTEGFKPILKAPEFSDLEALVRSRYFIDAEYHLVAKIDEKGYMTVSVLDWRENEIFSANHDELAIARNKQAYRCPEADFDLWVFILAGETFSTRKSSLAEVRDWLKTFGGIHLYHNGLRVTPYGDPGNDWLDMNLRRAQSPEERPSTNTSIGRVIVSDLEELLIQKTDRSGLIEGEAFKELRSFTQDAMEWMAARRLEEAEKRRAKERTLSSKKSSTAKINLDDTIQKAPKVFKEELQKAVEKYDKTRDREVDQLKREVQLYRTLSTAGSTAATFAHESNANPIKIINLSLKTIDRRAKTVFNEHYEKYLKKPIEAIAKATTTLAVLGTAILKLVDHQKRRSSRVDVHSVLKGILNTYKPFLEGRDVAVRMELFPGSPFLKGSEAAIESIFTNLINNSLAAFEGSNTPDRDILFKTMVNADKLTISVLDSGPGIVGISKKDIWLPGRTTRKNGTGLGLTIVRDAVKDLGGEVEAIEHCELGGAEIIISLRILGV